jgi:hypothetical protein
MAAVTTIALVLDAVTAFRRWVLGVDVGEYKRRQPEEPVVPGVAVAVPALLLTGVAVYVDVFGGARR